MVEFKNFIDDLYTNFSNNPIYYDLIASAEDCGSIEDAISYLSDIVNYGCISGIVGYAIYYCDIDELFIKYEDFVDEFYQSGGLDCAPKDLPLKTACVWALIEYHAYVLYDYVCEEY